MPFTSTNFSPPTELKAASFQLQVLSPLYAAQDYEAVMSSASEIRHVFGLSNDWPSETLSFSENMADLQRHETEFREGKAFAYAMLNSSGKSYLGCVYIKPIKSKIDNDYRKVNFQAHVFFWLSSLHREITVEQTLVVLKNWLSQHWPFHRVAFPGREIDWLSWERMAYASQGNATPEA